jgi:hypothetical protein
MAYERLEVGQAGNPASPDKYNEASTLICPRSNRFILQVAKQPCMVQLGIMQQGVGLGQGSVQWQPEKPFLPQIASYARSFDAIRVRNYTPGSPAEVMIAVDSV